MTIVKSLLLLPVKILLRRIVHTDRLWYAGLGAAWGKGDRVRPDTVWRYKLASMALDFDSDFGRFVASQTSAGNRSDKRSAEIQGKGGLAFTNCEIVPGVTQLDVLVSLLDLGVKVIIIHGVEDKIVPIENSQRMADLVQEALIDKAGVGSDNRMQVLALEGRGHVPHEEAPLEFLRTLDSVGINLLN